ncbi:MAG: hypothetical protein SFW66_02420 [Gammaproteobacteria bacterium]|nr:hypothetical protein [Gammaproteobacteria bacterium]
MTLELFEEITLLQNRERYTHEVLDIISGQGRNIENLAPAFKKFIEYEKTISANEMHVTNTLFFDTINFLYKLGNENADRVAKKICCTIGSKRANTFLSDLTNKNPYDRSYHPIACYVKKHFQSKPPSQSKNVLFNQKVSNFPSLIKHNKTRNYHG